MAVAAVLLAAAAFVVSSCGLAVDRANPPGTTTTTTEPPPFALTPETTTTRPAPPPTLPKGPAGPPPTESVPGAAETAPQFVGRKPADDKLCRSMGTLGTLTGGELNISDLDLRYQFRWALDQLNNLEREVPAGYRSDVESFARQVERISTRLDAAESPVERSLILNDSREVLQDSSVRRLTTWFENGCVALDEPA